MKKKKQALILAGILIVILAGLLIYYFNNKTYYNNVTDNGNTAGNLYNNGLFCQSGDTIYFSNLADDGALYSMDSKMGTYRKINSDKVNYINVSGHYIIYNRINNLKKKKSESVFNFLNIGVYRIKLNGKGMIRLDDTPAGTVHQFGNDILYLHYDKKNAYSLYTVDLNGNKQKEIYTESISSAMMTEDYLYFTGVVADHNIYRLTRDSYEKELVKEGNYSEVILQGDHMYALNNADKYTIVQMDLEGNDKETIVNDRVASYNLSNDGRYLFYQADGGDHNGIYCVDLSTGEQTPVQSGNYENLCITEDYLFFTGYNSSDMYYVKLSDPTTANVFKPDVK